MVRHQLVPFSKPWKFLVFDHLTRQCIRLRVGQLSHLDPANADAISRPCVGLPERGWSGFHGQGRRGTAPATSYHSELEISFEEGVLWRASLFSISNTTVLL